MTWRISARSGFMKPLRWSTGLLLRKLDVSCLTSRPLISSVNCCRLCECVFYRHIPLLNSSHFIANFINSAWDKLRSLWSCWKDHLEGCRFMLQHPLAYTHYSPCLMMRWWKLFHLRHQSVEWVYRWWES